MVGRYAVRANARTGLGLLSLLMACDSSEEYAWNRELTATATVENRARADEAAILTIDTSAIRTFRFASNSSASGDGSASIEFLDDGGIAATQRSVITFFRADGSIRTTFGRSGEGPGEFKNILATCRTRGDTLIVDDMGRRRLLIIDGRSATLVREINNDFGYLSGQGCFGDGSLLTTKEQLDKKSGVRALTFLRVDLLGRSDVLYQMELSRERLRETGSPLVAANGQVWWFADPYFSEVIAFTVGESKPSVVARFKEKPEGLSAAEAAKLQGVEPARGTTIRPKATGVRVRLPFFGAVLISTSGSIWVADRRDPAWPIVGWTVMDRNGRTLGRLLPREEYDPNSLEPIGITDSTVFLQLEDTSGLYLEERRWRISRGGK
jgi:hypothetical protein